jgi:predicted HAD superfamily Cof-like phosphohydrolase
MNTMQQMVRDFHRKCHSVSRDKPELPPPEMLLLRARLIVEEAGEFLKAATHQDMIEMIDALCDILYVTFGAADVMGVDLQPFFEEIQRSNMTKSDIDVSGKISKGVDYEPPNLLPILRSQEAT